MDENEISCEPMEIDLSGQSVNAMDISYYDSDYDLNATTNPSPPRGSDYSTKGYQLQLHTIGEQPTIKYFHINLKQRPISLYLKTFCKIFVAILIAFVSITTYYINVLKCCDQLNFRILNDTFANKLYGQSKAANDLIETLELKDSSKILFFSGGTGVGKTFTSSLIIDFLGPCSNVYHYTMPTFEKNFSPDMMFGLTVCQSSVVIVDDVTPNNNYIKDQINSLMAKSNNLGKEITVILIYNCNESLKDYSLRCDKLFNTMILNDFSEVQALKKVIQFEPLSIKILKQCIVQELGSRILSDVQFENFLKNFNVSVDGCKGVYSKMKYFNIL